MFPSQCRQNSTEPWLPEAILLAVTNYHCEGRYQHQLIKVSCDFGLQIKNLLIHPTGDYDVRMVNVQRATQGNTIDPLRRWLCQKFDLVFCGGVGWCSSRLWIINGTFSLRPGSSGGKHRMRGSWGTAPHLWHQEVKFNAVSTHWCACVPWMLPS